MRIRTLSFDFGENWKNYAEKSLNEEQFEQSKKHFKELFDQIHIKDRSFLDIGFGQGLALVHAYNMGAKTIGIDINPTCTEVLNFTFQRFNGAPCPFPAITGSVLEPEVVAQLNRTYQNFDIVHSWGVLHHTGNMYKSIKIAAGLVNNSGFLVLAIYNRHWSSGFWKAVKKIYVSVPAVVQKLMIYLFCAIIFVAKFLVTFKNPLNKKRGMSFYYDVIDWVGGYPYEYASVNEIKEAVEKYGFKLLKVNKPTTPTGCNEFVFRKTELIS